MFLKIADHWASPGKLVGNLDPEISVGRSRLLTEGLVDGVHLKKARVAAVVHNDQFPGKMVERNW